MTLPHVHPIIPIARKEPFDDPDWLFEMKYDGFRALCYIERGSGCRFISRRGNTLTRFDPLEAVAAELEVNEAILDGEAMQPTRLAARNSTISCDARGSPPMPLSTFSGSTVPICAPCPSASVGGACRTSYRTNHQSSPKPCRFKAGDTSFSSSCWRTIWRVLSRSGSTTPTTRASSGSKSRSLTTRRKRGEETYLTGRDRGNER
jgi:hypothetical protein